MQRQRLTLLIQFCAMIILTHNPVAAQTSSPELRGVWLTNVDSRVLESRAGIAAAMQFLADHHFNIVYPVVWNGGVTLYRSALMDSLFGIPIDPLYGSRDPLAEVIEEAHARGLAVVPWFEFGFSASYKEDGGHILRTRPAWAARDRDGRLLSKNGFEWMNGYHPDVQGFLAGLIREVVRGYAIDGIQGDDRLPAQPVESGYDAWTDSLFRTQHGGAAPPRHVKHPAWMRWRADILNGFAQRIYQETKVCKPEALVSSAPNIYPWCYEEYLQDWPGWIRAGTVEQLVPQVYRYDLRQYRATLDGVKAVMARLPQPAAGVYPGILIKLGDYLIDTDYLLGAIHYNRASGFNGEVLFFYEGLRMQNGKLATALLKGPYRLVAPLPR